MAITAKACRADLPLPGLAVNAGEVFPPYKTKQIEAGVKADHGSFMTTVAPFQIKQPSGITDPQTLIFSVDGERRHQGIELNTFASTMDLGARYSALARGRLLSVRLNVENVYDKAYWNSFDLVRGAPRTVLLSTRVAF